MKGLLITFEGIEGSGKSTQVGLLASHLKEKGLEIVVTREPGGTRIGEQIRNITHGRENVDLTGAAEAYLMAAARSQVVREIIRPALLDGKIVIVDRFLDSSLAYQGYGRELGEEEIMKLNQMAIDAVFPNLTIFLDIPVQEGFRRRNGTDKIDRLDLQQKEFYERVHNGYKKIASQNRERFVIIDGNRGIEEIAKEIWKKVEQKINPNFKAQISNQIPNPNDLISG